MKVAELGEFGLIDLLAKMIAGHNLPPITPLAEPVLGIGDDTAVWKVRGGLQLATTDCLVQDVHFTLETMSWEDLGWKSLAVNLSDIAAMGGTPLYALVALTLPGNTAVEDVVSLYRGLLDGADTYGVAISGGNVSGGDKVSLTVTVIGTADDEGRILRRSGARAGEKVAVTGYLGGAAAGLDLILGGRQLGKEVAAYARERFFRPRPRLDEGLKLARLGVKAVIDISDGLAADLGHLCRESGLGARINLAEIPVHPLIAGAYGQEAAFVALAGGEEYELLFTAGDSIITAVKETLGCPVTVIGEMVTGPSGQVDVRDAQAKPVQPPVAGWQHFRAA